MSHNKVIEKYQNLALIKFAKRFKFLERKSQAKEAFDHLKAFFAFARRREALEIISGVAAGYEQKRKVQALIKLMKNTWQEEVAQMQQVETVKRFVSFSNFQRHMKAAMIILKRADDESAQLMRAFGKWKRLELTMVLGGLQEYQAALKSKGGAIKKSVPQSLLREESIDSSQILNSIGNQIPKQKAAFASHQQIQTITNTSYQTKKTVAKPLLQQSSQKQLDKFSSVRKSMQARPHPGK